jgi:hypothetical protein
MSPPGHRLGADGARGQLIQLDVSREAPARDHLRDTIQFLSFVHSGTPTPTGEDKGEISVDIRSSKTNTWAFEVHFRSRECHPENPRIVAKC